MQPKRLITKEKVLAYIYRKVSDKTQVLVFDHPDVPSVNPQVPAGTLKENEDPEVGLLREVFEESGLEFSKVDQFLGKFEHLADYKNEIHQRYVYTIQSNGLPEKWSYKVKSLDQDNGEVFDFYWMDLEEAKEKLVVEQGKYLSTVNGHIVTAFDIQTQWVNEELKLGGLNSNLSQFFDLKRIAAQTFTIAPGYRSSEPHAESLEEEFVFVISGEIDLWLNGKIKKMIPGDCIGFPAGTGVGHCFINNYEGPCEIFVSGDRTKAENQYHFHLDPSLKKECGDKWWDTMPMQELGKHDGWPGTVSDADRDDDIIVFNAYKNLPLDPCHYPDDDELLTHGVCLSREFGMKNVSVWLEKLPAGNRSSWPHAHSHEEEFAYILKGKAHVWLNGEEFPLNEKQGIDFKPGSGVAHTLKNNSKEDVYYLCVGECGNENDKIFYPEHSKRNQEMKEKGRLWQIQN